MRSVIVAAGLLLGLTGLGGVARAGSFGAIHPVPTTSPACPPDGPNQSVWGTSSWHSSSDPYGYPCPDGQFAPFWVVQFNSVDLQEFEVEILDGHMGFPGPIPTKRTTAEVYEWDGNSWVYLAGGSVPSPALKLPVRASSAYPVLRVAASLIDDSGHTQALHISLRASTGND
jgi:hypothetical protein